MRRIIGLCTALMLFGSCTTQRKATDSTTTIQADTTTSITQHEQQERSTETVVKNDILGEYDMTYEFTRIDVPKDCTSTKSTITRGRLTLTAKRSDKSTTDSSGRSVVSKDSVATSHEEVAIKIQQSEKTTGLSFWEQAQLWCFRTITPLLLLLMLWIWRKPIIRLLKRFI